MSFFSEDSGAELKQLFFESAQELLQSLNEQGLSLEGQKRDPELIRSVRRTVHTLKGDSAAAGYRELSELTHQLEDVLTPELANREGIPLAELVLAAADVFSGMLAAYRNHTDLPSGESLRRLIQKVVAAAEKQNAVSHSSARDAAIFRWTEYERMVLAESAGEGQQIVQLHIELDESAPARAACYELVRKALEELGEIVVIRPETANDTVQVIEAAIATEAEAGTVAQKCRIPNAVSAVKVVPYGAEESDPTLAPKGGAQASGKHSQNIPVTRDSDSTLSLQKQERQVWGNRERGPDAPATAGETPALHSGAQADAARASQGPTEATLRVDAERIDTVLNLVGELIIGKSMLHQTLSDFDRRFPKDPLRGRFSDALAFQARVLTDLQKSVMKIRMVPVEQLFRRFPRLVRDVAKARGREVTLVISGEDTDLDKSILDVLAEPLTHLIRNAVDHGIEPTAERIAAGKPAQGTIRLNAFHQGNQVVIEISDDGRGIDREKIVAKALANKALTAEEAAHLDETEALDLIFHPGLSTAEEITSISGRGVGMDVVKTVLDRLKGTVQIVTRVGQGTTFYLKVPLTLAIIKALLFRVSEKIYAVPLASVVEITRAEESEFHVVDQHEVMQLRDEVLTLVRLEKLEPNGNGRNGSRKVFVVVIHLGERKFGLVVDKLVGEEELVIKALSDRLVATDLVSGASILGDGTVVLILNLTAVVARLGKIHGPGGGPRSATRHKEVVA